MPEVNLAQKNKKRAAWELEANSNDHRNELNAVTLARFISFGPGDSLNSPVGFHVLRENTFLLNGMKTHNLDIDLYM